MQIKFWPFLIPNVKDSKHIMTNYSMTHHIPKVTKQDCILSSAPKHTNVANFQRSIEKNVNINYQNLKTKWAANLLLCDGMRNLAVVLPLWPWRFISLKWKKGWNLSSAPKHADYAKFWRSIVNFYPQNSNPKTDLLSFLFLMITNT